MAKYFSLDELVRSEAAERSGIDNSPDGAAAARLEMLAERLLDPVRELWGGPLAVNSGYRSAALNAAVGGAARSQHLRGEAADITAGSAAANRRLFGMIVAAASTGDKTAVEVPDTGQTPGNGSATLEFDQLIDERDYSWLHISYREGRNRQQILHL